MHVLEAALFANLMRNKSKFIETCEPENAALRFRPRPLIRALSAFVTIAIVVALLEIASAHGQPGGTLVAAFGG